MKNCFAICLIMSWFVASAHTAEAPVKDSKLSAVGTGQTIISPDSTLSKMLTVSQPVAENEVSDILSKDPKSRNLLTAYTNEVEARSPVSDHNPLTTALGSEHTSEEIDQARQDRFFGRCDLTISNVSALYFKSAVDVWRPHFIRFKVYFNQSINVEPNPEVILPNNWIWTYYDPNGFFPYLKWPVDFNILSFNLLDSKTLHEMDLYLNINSRTENCSLKLGDKLSMYSIGSAFLNLTKDILVPMDTVYQYSYWCYLAEVPQIKNTTQYLLGIYLEFPVEFNRYNCCRTDNGRLSVANLHVHCNLQLHKMFEVTVIPYVLALIAFAYCPYLLLSIAKDLYQIQHTALLETTQTDRTQMIADTADGHATNDWIFLQENPPVFVFQILGGFCGLVKKYPVAASRIRRVIFVFFCPFVIFVQLYVYSKYKYSTTMALLEHGMPMGYLSLLGGLNISRQLFMPEFGGPIGMLAIWYAGGIIFIIIPTDLNAMFVYGTERNGNLAHLSPLFFSVKQLERLSHVSVKESFGYSKACALLRAGMCMLTNPTFWVHAVSFQTARYTTAFHLSSVFCRLVLILCSPLYLCLCICELVLCVLYYGIPVVTFICFLFNAYAKAFSLIGTEKCVPVSSFMAKLIRNRILAFIVICFLYVVIIVYLIAFCFLFVSSLAFFAEVVMLALMAVIIYPSYSFGYLFFTLSLMYYVFKQAQGFGEGYKDLLADAVEVSLQLEHQANIPYVYNGTLVLEGIPGAAINKIQVRNQVFTLPTNLTMQIQECQNVERQKVLFRDHCAGIPNELFKQLVREFRPLHTQVAKIVLKTFLITALLAVTISILVGIPVGPKEGISEVMHVVFVIAIGVLPRMLEVTMGGSNEMIAKEIWLRKIKSRVLHYWLKDCEVYLE